MPEIKRTFSGSKMNKDMDERLVPPTEYRDALNIEVNSSEDSDVGTVQTILGNTALTSIFPTGSTCVGSIADTKNDKIYWLVAGAAITTNNVTIKKDYVVEWDVQTGVYKYILVDIYKVEIKAEGASTAANGFLYSPEISSIDSYNNTGIRLGMVVTGTNATTTDNYTVTDIQTDTNKWKILTSTGFVTSDDEDITFTSQRLLNFDASRLVTGINVLDGMLFWTDDYSEPKKINIERCALGTGGIQYLKGGTATGFANAVTTTPTSSVFNQIVNDIATIDRTDHFHTRLVSSKDGNILEVMTNRLGQKAIWLEEEHITVLRKPPLTPPYLEMSSTEVARTTGGVSNNISSILLSYSFTDGNGDLLTAGPTLIVDPLFEFEVDVDFRVGDTIILTNNPDANTSSFIDHEVRIRIESIPIPGPPSIPSAGPYNYTILSVNSNIGTSEVDWSARLEQSKPLFESKFPRFAYRYKYKDGEYSAFSPFSEIAFLAGNFYYLPKQGYNLGMVNQLRSLKITDYIVEDSARGADVVEVDILFKNENSPNIYTVKTIKQNDAHPIWPDSVTYPYDRGEYEIESELIHAAVPANQLLRPWDNVPIKAKAQDITGNRLIYGNYVQNYDLTNANNKTIIPDIKVTLESTFGDLVNGVTAAEPTPSKSVKSIRTYQVGVVYRDKYGRETPVLAGDSVDGAIEIHKKECIAFNKIKAQINSEPPAWADSWKFFVKETSNEYYNLAMDRWYDAEDGNVWISFPSEERNKVQEDTFLILKKQHNSNIPVTDDARYKVIAVENEAPDFVKINLKEVGKLVSFEDEVDNNNFPYVGYQHFHVDAEALNKQVLAMTVSANIEKDPDLRGVMHSGYLWCRIGTSVSPSRTSNWYKISNLVEGINGSSDIKITIDGIFGEDMNFISPAQTTADVIDGLYLEIVTKIPENKAEFDGRFFVKIYKDLVLVDNILSKSGGDDWSVVNSMTSYYINYSNVLGGNTPGSLPEYINSGDNADYDIYPKGHSTDTSVNAHFYKIDAGGTSGNTREAVQAWWRAWNNIGEGPDERGSYYNGGGWFIDSAVTANEVTNEEAKYGGDPLGNLGGPPILGGPVSPVNSNNNNMAGDFRVLHNSDMYSGKHGVFDAAANSYMDNPTGISGLGTGLSLSWSGVGIKGWKHNEAPENWDVGGSIEPAQAPYMDLLQAVGTKFRFSADPDKIVYTIKYTSTLQNRYNFDSDDGYLKGAFDKIENKRLTLKLVVENDDAPVGFKGIGESGKGYNPTTSDTSGAAEWTAADSNSPVRIEFVELYSEDDIKEASTNPAIFETEPKEDVGLDIYYEATQAYPISIDYRTNEQYAKYGSIARNETNPWTTTGVTVNSWSGRTVTISATPTSPTTPHTSVGNIISFEAPDGGVTRLVASESSTGQGITFENTPHDQTVTLPFSNCFSFGNGVESDRIRDDYNEITIENGVKASTVLAEHYEQERRGAGMIHSGIYNSTSGKNDLNQFIQAEAITKDLNPRHGSIQKLINRNTNIVAITEDKCFSIMADKDMLFNADGSSQVIASSKVLGQATAYTGDFGTTNPESFAQDNFRAYFVDQARGKVCRLSMDGVTPISSAGMHDWFADNLQVSSTSSTKTTIDTVIGSFDAKKQLYNVTIKQKATTVAESEYASSLDTYYTLSYSEMAKGWVSFKSFYQESGLSINNEYYTWKDAELYKHHDNATRNNFYGVQYDSSVTTILNDSPGSIKSFNALNYEGSQAKIIQHNNVSTYINPVDGTTSTVTGNVTDANGVAVPGGQLDGDYYNLNSKTGWYVDSFETNEQSATVPEFIEKEGKWFNYIRGVATVHANDAVDLSVTSSNLDQQEFSVQGIGVAATITPSGTADNRYKLTVANAAKSDGTSGTTWDSTPD